MVATGIYELEVETNSSSYDRISELKKFDDSKSRVQGLVENGVKKVPRIFHHGNSDLSDYFATESSSNLSIPIIDLTGIHGDPTLRDNVVENVRHASENWGFFQVLNHGIPTHVLDEMIKGTCRFHQQESKVRKEYYTRDPNKKVVYVSNYSLFHDPFTTWRDSLGCLMAPHPPNAEELPPVCSLFLMTSSKAFSTEFYPSEQGQEFQLHLCLEQMMTIQ